MSQYPQHEKLANQRTEHHVIEGFLDWLVEKGFWVVDFNEWGDYMRVPEKQLIAEFLGIDMAAFEDEKMAMLKEIRAENAKAKEGGQDG